MTYYMNALEKMLDVKTNCGRWSETVAMRFPEIESGPRLLSNKDIIN